MNDMNTFVLISTVVAVAAIAIGVIFPAIAMGRAIATALDALSLANDPEHDSQEAALPLDMLKIDQSFVRDATHDPNDAEIIRAIVAMARSLGLALIAEGVEQQDQLDFLQAQGCHLYQGYLFSKPLPQEAFRELLERQRA